ncbi:MAG: diadenylate cyclase [Puniceicoccales bacterium]|jgi:DNA integrity scanning protein DisA with diadenylate cyclase activity/mannitol/fructose-specific phosphotransferase system IIA component (Ntr-type)|nr:diadenylate cyclase [Puniceicoccales bacterium]
MILGRYFNYDSIVELSSSSFKGAMGEILSTSSLKGGIDEIVSKLEAKENENTSYIGNRIAVSYLCSDFSSSYEICIGWSKSGIRYGFSSTGEHVVCIVALLLVSKKEHNFLKTIADLVNFFQRPSVARPLQKTETFEAFKATLIDSLKNINKKVKFVQIDPNEIFLKNAVEIAQQSQCTNVMLFGNIDLNNIDIEEVFSGIGLVNIIQSESDSSSIIYDSLVEFHVNVIPTNWIRGFRGIILLGIANKIFRHDAKICCVGSNTVPNVLDTLFIVDVQNEFHQVISPNAEFLQDDIKPEVLERVLSIATEIAIEGREGKAVGCLFVIGNIDKISLYMKPLVCNPFYGYPESERDIFNPFMDETIKEFSLIDGAFVIRGDGIIESAGTLIYTPNHNVIMPGGFGTRHTAAASISSVAECIAIAVSESTHAVTLFKSGQMLQVMQK